MHWSLPLQLHQLMRKTAFLIAIVSARRPSEVSALRCDPNHLILGDDFIRFIPARLSKTDRQSHLGPPIVIKPWKEDRSICPVDAVRHILSERRRLEISHSQLFFDWNAPFEPMDTLKFSRCIKWCLDQAGIQAPPGSTRSIASSVAYARGASIGDVLGLGDWSSSQTFFRFYATDL